MSALLPRSASPANISNAKHSGTMASLLLVRSESEEANHANVCISTRSISAMTADREALITASAGE